MERERDIVIYTRPQDDLDGHLDDLGDLDHLNDSDSLDFLDGYLDDL